MNTIDGVFVFDTTGSMSPCIAQVRKKVRETCAYLLEHIPNLRLGILTHGDWCDGNKVISHFNLVSVRDSDKLDAAIAKMPNTGGGDSDECYEYAMYALRNMFSWKADQKFAVMIGDAEPHHSSRYSDYGTYRNELKNFNGESPDWKQQLTKLAESGIKTYPIQALGGKYRSPFWDGFAEIMGVPKLTLDQFSDINQILTAVCMQQAGKLDEYESSIVSSGSYSSSVIENIDRLSSRAVRKRVKSEYSDLEPVSPSRFQVLEVDTDTPIAEFVRDNGLRFNVGRGFYEFTKRVLVQARKEVIIRDNANGDFFTGDQARKILGIPVGVDAKVSPMIDRRYTGFIQSTSANRLLLGGTKFLYEVS